MIYECHTHGRFEERFADCPTCAISCPEAAPEITEAMVERALTALNKHFASQLRLQHGYMLTLEAVEIAFRAAFNKGGE